MSSRAHPKEGRSSRFCALLAVPVYRVTRRAAVRAFVRRWVLRSEGGAVYSLTIRQLLRQFHGLDIGLYTIGPCESPLGNLAPGTSVGRYSSIYYTVRSLAHDGPAPGRPAHGLFCESALGSKPADPVRLVIGHDVFVGHNAILLASVDEIGNGAFISAGSVVTRPVPPYAVVMGTPARVVRYRFPEDKIRELIDSQWWLKSIDELSGELDLFRQPLDGSRTVR